MPRVTLPFVLSFAAETGRICPKPLKWSALYEMLPDKRHDGYGFIPASPLILDAWGQTSDEQKAERLKEHLKWADENGALDRVYAFLASLREGEWHHVGE